MIQDSRQTYDQLEIAHCKNESGTAIYMPY